MTVFDASALLAYLTGEPGADLVESLLTEGGSCSAANWSEVAQKVQATGEDWHLARSLLLSFDLAIEPVTLADAEWAATRWRRGEGLSLGDRLCLALGHRLGDVIVTTDRGWDESQQVRHIR